MLDKKKFPPTFTWGVATSAYQIEGAVDVDGRLPSIWDVFSQTQGNIKDGTDGSIACDHYHRYPDDVALMKSLGIQSYRFSIAWPRIIPRGRGSVNEKGLDFYNRLVDELLNAGITPAVTLYHWDLPAELQEAGGWANRDILEAFEGYTDVVTRKLGDRVKFWITHNEPWVAAFLGHQIGEHAPGIQDWTTAILAAHHILVSHGRAVDIVRQNVFESEVGITLNFTPSYPASKSAEDYHAARIMDGYQHRWFTEPLYGRQYPQDMVAHYIDQGHIADLSFVHAGDYETISVQTDFLGINYYTREIVRDESPSSKGTQTIFAHEKTDIGWEVFPHGLYDLVNRLYFEYHPPKMYITENGAAYSTEPEPGGSIRDQKRIEYLNSHLTALHRAMLNGIPIAGYYLWSLLDNFEWAWGYAQRFGIVWVDYETLERTPKDSAYWYSQVIRNNALP